MEKRKHKKGWSRPRFCVRRIKSKCGFDELLQTSGGCAARVLKKDSKTSSFRRSANTLHSKASFLLFEYRGIYISLKYTFGLGLPLSHASSGPYSKQSAMWKLEFKNEGTGGDKSVLWQVLVKERKNSPHLDLRSHSQMKLEEGTSLKNRSKE